MRITAFATALLLGALGAQAFAATHQYARTARAGKISAYMYKTSQAYCNPVKGVTAIKITNNTAVEVLKTKLVSCGHAHVTLVKANVVEGAHAGEHGYFVQADLKAAPDLAH